MSMYSPGASISFDSPKHKMILDRIKRRWKLSRNKMSDRYETWREAEKKFVAYIKPTEGDRKRETLRDSGKGAQYTTIEIPYSYAQLLAAHTYWTSVFLGRTPIMQFTGRHGETENSVQALEAIIDYQINVGQMLVPFYIWLMDVGKYGIGVLGNYWDHETANVAQLVEVPKTYMGIPIPGTKQKVRQVARVTSYMGNRSFNVRPYDWFPDPRVPIAQFQQGEFCGRYVESGWNMVKARAEAGIYQNLEKLKGTKPGGWQRETGSQHVTLPNTDGGGDATTLPMATAANDEDMLDYVSIFEMCIELIPSEWDLGSQKTPEKWMFTVGNDAVLLRAAPLGCLHNKFPFSIIELEIEGYGLFKRGMLEITKPLNDVLTWLFNAHFHNVRKVLNDQLVVDPSRVVMKDVTDPNAGRILRLRPEAYGTDARTAVHQLQVVDITRSHLVDATVIEQMIQRLTGASDPVMGVVNQGGRKTATEVRTSSTFGINRLKTNAEFFSAQGFSSHAQMMVQNSQQYYDQAFNFRIAGELTQNAGAYMQVSPDDIAGFYDFVPVDGTLPIDRFAMAALWKDLLANMRNVPSLMIQYDLGAIFAHIAHLAGIKNVNQFKLQVTPDQVLAAQLQAGNVVPIGGSRGGRGGGTAERPPGPRQIPGVGPAS